MEIWIEISEMDRRNFLEIINYHFKFWRIDLDELKGKGEPFNDYRKLRPYGGNCNCWGGTPEEEERYHEFHIKRCLNYLGEMQDFCNQIINLIKKKGKEFKEKKEQVIKKIEAECIAKNVFHTYYEHEQPIWNCTNSKQLAKKEAELIQELSSQAQVDEEKRKKQEEENERLRKEEEEKQQKYQENWEGEQKKFEEKLKRNQNPKNSEENKKLNDLKNKFRELYQKGKKYKWIELTTLFHILDEIGKETILDNYFLDAKTELQIIQNKLVPFQSEIFMIISRGENAETQLKGLNKYELKRCKKALEDMQEVIYLSPQEEHLLKEINDKLKTLDLEEEIKQLKNNKTENPQQQKENQKKIAEKEQELEKFKENKDISKEITNTKQKISQMLKNYKLKTADLSQKYQNWEKELEKLDSKEKINDFSQQLEQEIEQKSKELKSPQTQNQKGNNNEQPSLSVGIKIFIGEVAIILVFTTVLLLVQRKRVKLRK